MAREWQVTCKDCNKEFGYSDSSYQADASRGRSRPERCPECRKKHNRQTNAMGLAYYNLKPRKDADTGNITVGRLGAISHEKREHTLYELSSSFDPSKFGITEEDIRSIFEWFNVPAHQVVVVEGPTGSGKSTVLPFSLISPPAGIPEDFFTRNGQIVVTQPRIQATRNIPAYVAKELYGSNIGAGYDIGFRYSNHPFSDWRNKLVYITDGTLINWIVSGQIANLSLIMIDEAHERSLNIDLILGLLKKLLPRYPHLKLIIASATIDAEMFIDYFGRENTGHVSFKGMQKHFVKEYYRFEGNAEIAEDEYWMNVAEIRPPLPYSTMPQLRNMIADELSQVVVWLLSEIAEGRKQPGDILGFLHGEKPIQDAVAKIRQAIVQDKRFSNVYVCPLYTTLLQSEQDAALKPKPDPSKRRVVITTNVAETSLTVEDIIYVVDSGLINQDQWDPISETKQVVPVLQSQAGCKQRWGRAGRITDGEAYCLYTKKQFHDLFPEYTKPQIQRAPLEQIVLTAKAAGIDNISDFHWIQKPPTEELERAPQILRKKGALDGDGDLTEHGLELQMFAEEPSLANLMILADRFSCAVEMATLLPMIKIGNLRRLLKWDRNWDAYTRRAVNQIHRALMQGCFDDVEFCLKLYTAWSEVEFDDQPIDPEWAFREAWPKHIPHFSKEIQDLLGDEQTRDLRKKLEACIDIGTIEQLLGEYDLAEVGESWLSSLSGAMRRASREAWACAFYINHTIFRDKIEPERRKLLDDLSGHKKDEEIRPIDFDLIDRVRIIIAYCLPERICEGLHSTKTFQAAEGQTPISLYQLRGYGLEGEAATRQKEMPVQINSDSTLFDSRIAAFVSCKQQVITHKLSPTAPPEPVNHVSLVSLIRPEWTDWLACMHESPIILGKFIAAQTRGTNGRLKDNDVYRRLFIDFKFPVGARYECVVERVDHEGVVWLTPRAKITDLPRFREVVELDSEDDSGAEYQFEEGDAASDDLSDTYLDRLDRAPVENIEDDSEPAWVSLTGDEREIDDSTREDELQPEFYEEVSGFLPSCRLIDPSHDFAPGDILLVEIVGFDFTDFSSPTVVFVAIPNEKPVNSFAQRFNVGNDVTLRVNGHDARPGDQQVSLVAREITSSLEILLAAEDVSFARSNFAIREIPIGVDIQATIENIDVETGRVKVSLLPALEADLKKHLPRNDNTYLTRGVIKDISRGRVFIRLDWSDPSRGIIHIATAAGGGLHKEADKYVPGEECEVKISPSPYPARIAYEQLPDELNDPIEKQRRFNNLNWENGELSYSGRMSYELRNEIKSLTDDISFHRVVNELYIFSNRFFIRTSMANWKEKVEERYKLDQWIEDREVYRVENFGAFVQLDEEFSGLIHKSQITQEFVEDATIWIAVGDRVNVRIIRIDPEKQQIGLSLKEKQILIDPYTKYQVGQVLVGTVKNIVEYGAFVEIERGINGLLHKKEISSDWVQNVSDVLQIGQQVTVVIISIDVPNKRIGLSIKQAQNK